MGIFGTIMSKLGFGDDKPAEVVAEAARLRPYNAVN